MSLTKATYSMIDGAFVNVTDRGVLADGTDQTTAMTTVLAALGTEGYRGGVYIPRGVSFNTSTVYAAIPTGTALHDYSGINFNYSGSYKQSYAIIMNGDLVNDDSGSIVGSTHHPTIQLLNTGTAGSTSADNFYASILQNPGINKLTKNTFNSRQLLFFKSPSSNAWRMSLISGAPYVAVSGIAWESGVAVTTGDYCYTQSYYYVAASTGTTGGTIPSHTSGTVSDGGVDWTYVGPLTVANTDFYVESDGTSRFLSLANIDHALVAGSKIYRTQVDSSTGQVTITIPSSSYPILFQQTTAGYAFAVGASSVTSRKYQFGMNANGDLEIYDTAAAAVRATITANGSLKQQVKTVATLPNPATEGAGARSFVSDANATTFASVVAGGGANQVPVYSDGTNWRIG